MLRSLLGGPSVAVLGGPVWLAGETCRVSSLATQPANDRAMSRPAASDGDDVRQERALTRRGRYWQVQLAGVMQILLPPGTSSPGEQDADLSPQLTSHPPQAPLGADLGALHLLFLPG